MKKIDDLKELIKATALTLGFFALIIIAFTAFVLYGVFILMPLLKMLMRK